MSEVDDIISGPDESSCSECHHVFNLKTGEIVKGLESIIIVSPGPLLCARCKESVIEALEKGVPGERTSP